ncbi:ABC transporter ATP-binding protein [bacterium]|nr:ABC transporter ATP-binding protein [bacterium]
MAFIEIKKLYKTFDKVEAISYIDLEIEEGELITLLGPSGCGKTTTLRCIAGLEKPEGGDIIIDGKSMIADGFVHSSKRGIGMVFQNYAVWPHMKVYTNVAYGLKLQKAPRHTIEQSVMDVLKLVGLAGLENRYPSQLSGGQQQRVALARALVRNPKVLLLDEPLSNLDAKLREELRFEIKSLVRRMGITSVYVTHDQAEAMVISDRVAVMFEGKIVQIGTPNDIYRKPINRFVADFIGTMNFMPAEMIEVAEDKSTAVVRTGFTDRLSCRITSDAALSKADNLFASLRPEDIEMFAEAPQGKENCYKGTITNRAYLGNLLFFFVDVSGVTIRVQASHLLLYEEGQDVYLHLNPDKCLLLL